jgi:hypothetical protein
LHDSGTTDYKKAATIFSTMKKLFGKNEGGGQNFQLQKADRLYLNVVDL